MGATLVAGGATFRAWAPHATAVYLVKGSPGGQPATYQKQPSDLLVKDSTDRWGELPK